MLFSATINNCFRFCWNLTCLVLTNWPHPRCIPRNVMMDFLPAGNALHLTAAEQWSIYGDFLKINKKSVIKPLKYKKIDIKLNNSNILLHLFVWMQSSISWGARCKVCWFLYSIQQCSQSWALYVTGSHIAATAAVHLGHPHLPVYLKTSWASRDQSGQEPEILQSL